MVNCIENAKAIFLTTIEQVDAADWSSHLDVVCAGDPVLRAEIDELLRAHQELGEFRENKSTSAEVLGMSEMQGLQIGPYTVISLLGEGGMGAVFAAEQREPVVRRVALKIIKPGMDTRDVIARFEAERQTLAMMTHPNIARVYDAGTTESGRPFFVMELVSGTTITNYCTTKNLSIRERLELFIIVCRAVHHCHQKGIIHRDLKPGNLMVDEADGCGVVKVIDFGVAKPTTPLALASKSIRTHCALMIGTPQYMSPEQAVFSSADVDTRSDIYSLGVVLYELLTGTTPIDRRRLSGAAVEEVHRIIREEEPRRPSEQVTINLQSEPTGPSPKQPKDMRLGKVLNGELDWIVLKSLEKDRNRRYESASAFADDVQRFLDDEPVKACPPTRAYRLQKYVRKNRAVLTTTACVMLALLAGLTIAAWQAIVATRAVQVAGERLQREKTARREADKERDRANAVAELSRRLLYASDLSQALRAWHRNDVVRKRELLGRHRPASGQQDLRGFEWHYLWNQTSIQPRIVAQSERPLYFCVYSPDGKMLAAAGADDQIRLFDSQTFEPLVILAAGQREVNGLAFTSDSQTLASAGDDGTVVLWDVRTNAQLRKFRAHEAAAFQVQFIDQDQSLVTCGNDEDIRLWSADDGRSLGTLQHHTAKVEAIALSPGGTLAAASKSGHCTVWDMGSRKWQHTIGPTPLVAFNAIAISADSGLMATGQSNGVFAIRRLPEAVVQAIYPIPDPIHSVALSPITQGRMPYSAAGDRNGLVHLFPMAVDNTTTGLPLLETQRQSWQWLAHQGRVFGITFSPDGRQLITAGEDGRLCGWKLDMSNATRVLQSDAFDLLSLGGNRVLTSHNHTLTELDVAGFEPVRIHATSKSRGVHLTYAPVVQRVFGHALGRDEILSWSMNSKANDPIGRSEWSPDPGEKLRSFAVTPDGANFAVVCTDTTDQSWLTVSGKAVHQRIPCANNSAPMCSPDGRLFVYSKEKDLFLLDSSTGESLGVLEGHRTTTSGYTFSSDGALLATTSQDRTVRVWDLTSCRQLWSETAHANDTQCVAFAPGGQTIATTGGDGMLRLWRWQDATMTFELPLVAWPVDRLMFSEDGMRIVVREKQLGTIRVYDAQPLPSTTVESRPIAIIPIHLSPLKQSSIR